MAIAIRADLVQVCLPLHMHERLSEDSREVLDGYSTGPIIINGDRVTYHLEPEKLAFFLPVWFDLSISYSEFAPGVRATRVDPPLPATYCLRDYLAERGL